MIRTYIVSIEIVILTTLLFYWSEGATRLLAGLGGIIRGGRDWTLETSWNSRDTIFQFSFLIILEFTLIDTNDLIDKEFKSFLSSDYRDDILDI